MYKALIDIGDYKKGEIVPDEIAVVWQGMYAVSPVEKVDGEAPKGKEVNSKEEDSVKKDSSEVMLDDYLNRGKYVVRSNIQKDDLSEETLHQLLELENKNKKRKQVIEAIKAKLKEIR